MLRGAPPGIIAPHGSLADFVWTGRFECALSPPSSLPTLTITFGYPRQKDPRLSIKLPPSRDGYIGRPLSYSPTGTYAEKQEREGKYSYVMNNGIAIAQLLAVKWVAEREGKPIRFYLSQEQLTMDLGDFIMLTGIERPVLPEEIEPTPFSFYRQLAEELGWKHRYNTDDILHALSMDVPHNGFHADRWLRTP